MKAAAEHEPEPPEAPAPLEEAEEGWEPDDDVLAAGARAEAVEAERAAERAEDDAFEQLEQVGRVAVLRDLRKEWQAAGGQGGEGGGGREAVLAQAPEPRLSGSSSSDSEGDDFLDWRRKGL